MVMCDLIFVIVSDWLGWFFCTVLTSLGVIIRVFRWDFLTLIAVLFV